MFNAKILRLFLKLGNKHLLLREMSFTVSFLYKSSVLFHFHISIIYKSVAPQTLLQHWKQNK